ncbi:AAA+ superfamily ATPase [Nanobdella aerobiophila]|uniref:AAA+ superfamily ATPase n=1 Tax=Nanobdella aerobiophila TaxID=2586965 RepID=A0A915SCW4_9ARCH|nr:ATP-binding protein [Nanobdella aerobiophila]BBL45718.1 AAA+ superfamily ATPase [Nanobdella aerobiophila]
MDIKDYFINKKEYIKRLKIYPRELSININKEFVFSIIGPRRSGKTYFLYDLILNKLKLRDEDYIFINFEEEGLDFDKDRIYNIIKSHIEIYEKEPEYLFFDEIQNLKDWEKFIYTLYEQKKYYIFITGSSSKLLSKEIATQFRGRSISYIILPFNFKEILYIKGFEIKKYYTISEKGKILNILNKYLQSGGYPQLILTDIDEQEFFKSLIDSIFYRDIIERYKIKQQYLLELIIKILSSSFSSQYSINKIYNSLKSSGLKVSKKTVYNYIRYLENVFLIFSLRHFDFSIKKMELANKKLYFIDNGIINYLLNNRIPNNIGRLMENTVFIELYKKYKENVYYLYGNNYEIDFLIKEGNNIKQLIQVSYINNYDEIDKREIRSLLKGYKLFNKPELLIITWDYEDTKIIDNINIKFIPLYKWLLNI